MYTGIINIYKEKGYSSFDVIAKLRGILHQKKIGHTGTLDPDAEGVLPVCVGRATKVCDLLSDRDKEYETVLLLGRETDTQDISGRIVSEAPVKVTASDVQKVIAEFVGAYDQLTPMYSARKVNGKKLYEYAREGVEVARKKKRVFLFSIEITGIDLPRVRMRVHCSKGTYIRTLCHDIGNALGCYGCMEALTRTRVGPFTRSDAIRLSEVEEYARQNRIEQILLPTDQLFPEYPAVHAKAGADKLIVNGNRIPADLIVENETLYNKEETQTETQKEDRKTFPVRLYDAGDEFVGLYAYRMVEEDYKPLCLLKTE